MATLQGLGGRTDGLGFSLELSGLWSGNSYPDLLKPFQPE